MDLMDPTSPPVARVRGALRALFRASIRQGLALSLGALASGCSPCSSLEGRICEALGEDCSVWREIDRPGLPNGRRAFRSCVNASLGSQYDLALRTARISVEAMRKTRS